MNGPETRSLHKPEIDPNTLFARSMHDIPQSPFFLLDFKCLEVPYVMSILLCFGGFCFAADF